MALLVLGVGLAPPAPSARAGVLDDVDEAIGLTSLRARLGSQAPTGAGVEFTQVEFSGPPGNAYLPNGSQSELVFDTIIDQTGGGIVSSHATGVARVAYGSNGVAPGVSSIHVYSSTDWLNSGYLNTQTNLAPAPSIGKVQNHSWVVTRDTNSANDAQEDAQAIDALRRLDLAIVRDGVVAVVGVNNGSGSEMPLMLANSYNSIAVGQANAGSSLGPSTLDVVGRSRPDLVAPGDFPGATPTVSRATARVSAAAALLLEAGSGQAGADRPEVIKALLLTGATKESFDLDHSTATTLDDWSHSATQPLDLRFGAGLLNVDNSDLILAAGQQAPSSAQLVPVLGWDQAQLAAGTQRYFFRLPAGASLESFTATAAWNREVSFTPEESGAATLAPSLANVDLRLYRAEVNSSHTAYQVTGAPIQASLSAIDNVEHVFDRDLGPGLYALEVTSSAAAQAGIAWNARFTAPPVEQSFVVASLDNQRLIDLAPSGAGTVLADTSDGLFTPLAVAYDALGRLFVADTLKSQILRFDTPGGPGVVFADLQDGIATPSGLAFDAQGNLYVSSYLSDSIRRIDSGGNASLFADASDGLDGPFGMDFDAQGNLIVASLENKKVVAFSAAGMASVLADSSDGLFTPISVAVDSSGDVFIADTLTSRVWRLDSSGAVSSFADLADGIVSPSGLAFDADDQLLVANYLADTIVRLDPLGNATLVADSGSGISGPWSVAVPPLVLPPASLAARFEGASVPEPATWVLALLGAAALALVGWRQVRRRIA